jgi:phospholipid/cholesterol/gamma-HCH transport system ATP-binding protein
MTRREQRGREASGPAGVEPPPADAEWPIRVRGLHKTFVTHHVLRGVDLDVARGKINVIIGGSGQGKTVLMKHLMGLIQPDAGGIWVDGEEISGRKSDDDLSRIRRKFGMVFQYGALFDSMTVTENIAFPLIERYRLPRAQVIERVRELLKRLDIESTELKFPSEISGGQRKRVALARAVIDRPQILLYDEPTTGLDPVATKNVDDLIQFTSAEFGVTSVVISHDMASTFRIGDRVSMLYEGKILVSGSREEIVRSGLEPLRAFLEPAGIQLSG